MGSEPPEVIIVDAAGNPEQPADRAPRRDSRRAALLVIGAVLVFGLGVVVGGHLGDGQVGDGATGPSPTTSPATPETSSPSHAETSAPARTSPAQTATTPTEPTTTTIEWAAAGSPGAAGWELVGYRAGGASGTDPGMLVRFDPSGTIVTTPVPPLWDQGQASFAATDTGAVIVANSSSGDSYVVADGKGATPVTGALDGAWSVFPAADGQHLWVSGGQNYPMALIEVGLDGAATGGKIPVPAAATMAPWSELRPDGAGYVLARGIGGTYDLRPDGAELVTPGQLLAIGPTGYLAWECDLTGGCETVAIDRATRSRQGVPGLAYHLSNGPMPPGVISLDGTHAALSRFGADGPVVDLIDLASGHSTTVSVGMPEGYFAMSTIAFTPDGGTLLVASAQGVLRVDVASGQVLDAVLPIPAVDFFVIRTRGEPPPDSRPPVLPARDSPATDTLIPGTAQSFDRNESAVTITTQLQNNTDAELTLSGAPRLRGGGGTPIPGSSVSLIAGWDDRPGATPLTAIGPRQHVRLVITVPLDCASPSSAWLDDPPTVIIPLNEFAKPWAKTLDRLAFDDLRSRLCD